MISSDKSRIYIEIQLWPFNFYQGHPSTSFLHCGSLLLLFLLQSSCKYVRSQQPLIWKFNLACFVGFPILSWHLNKCHRFVPPLNDLQFLFFREIPLLIHVRAHVVCKRAYYCWYWIFLFPVQIPLRDHSSITSACFVFFRPTHPHRSA